MPRGAVISSIGGKSVVGLDDFIAAISSLPDGERSTMRYSTLDDPKGSETRVMRMDRSWFPARVCVRDDATGTLAMPRAGRPPASAVATPAILRTSFAEAGRKGVDALAASLVLVSFDMPFSMAGITERNYHGTGVVVDAERGPRRRRSQYGAGRRRRRAHHDRRLDRGAGKSVEYMHPLHNIAIVSFEPAALDGTPIRAVRFDTSELRAGEAVTVVGLGGDSQLRSIATSIASVDDVNFPLSRTLQFRDANLEVASLVNSPTGFDGVLVGKDGRVRALWSSFATEGTRDTVQVSRGMPAELVLEAVEAARSGKTLYSLETEFEAIPIAAARKLGLPAAWVGAFEARNPAQRQVLTVARVAAGSPAAGVLRGGRRVACRQWQDAEPFPRGRTRHAVAERARDRAA